MKRQVLFLCANNSLHGPIAEALLRHIDSRNFEAFSAGMSCEEVHPLSREVMKEIGVDLPQRPPTSVADLRGKTFDFVITLDEATAAEEGTVMAATDTVHWKFENPLAVSDEPEAQRRALRLVRDQIATRLRLFTIVYVRPSISERTHLAEERGSKVMRAG